MNISSVEKRENKKEAEKERDQRKKEKWGKSNMLIVFVTEIFLSKTTLVNVSDNNEVSKNISWHSLVFIQSSVNS